MPAYPPRQRREQPRLRAIIEDARPRFVLTTSAIAAKLAALADGWPALAALAVLTIEEAAAGDGEGWVEPHLEPSTLAFLQYTSGSTSEPKGVMVSHGNLVHNFEVIRTACGHSEASTFVSWLPIYHDMGLIGGVLQPLGLGALCVLMAPAAFLQRPARWLQAISRYRAQTSGGPDFAYDLCVRRIPPEQRAVFDLGSWRVAFNGSEPVRAATLEAFAEAFAPGGFRREAFFPCYGLAESTLIVAGELRSEPLVRAFRGLEGHRAEQTSEGDGQPLVGCGPAGLGHELAIADPETLEERPPGRVGEIWVAGASVALGYWNRPEETARTFGARLAGREEAFLRTGDLGFIEEGRLFVTGRLKDLMIVRGRNLYPQDLEATVRSSHPALRGGAGAAFGVESEGGEAVALVHEIDLRSRPDLEEALEVARRAVAEQHDIGLAALLLVRPGAVPRTTSGKVQRQLCRQRFLAGLFEPVAVWQPGAAPREVASGPACDLSGPEPLAAWLLDRLAVRLGVPPERLGADMPLARLGLDSMAAVDLMHEIERATGVDLPLAGLLESPSVRHLAGDLLGRSPGRRHEAASASAAGEPGGEIPLSPGQRGIWFEQRRDPEGAAYNITGAARLGPDVEPAVLRRAFAALAERHPALRTTFHADPDGEPVQRIHPRLDPLFREEEAAGWREEMLQERLREEAFRPFDLEAGPLLRVALFRHPEGSCTLLLAVHHLVADFWSLAVLLRELDLLVAAERSGGPAGLPPLTGSEEHIQGAGEASLRYWTERLSGFPPALEIPTDQPRPLRPRHEGRPLFFSLEAATTQRLRSLARRQDATLFAVLLALFQELLRRLAQRERVLVGSPSPGRRRASLAGTVGYFVNLLPLASQEGEVPFGAAVERARRTLLEAFAHEVPFPLLVERLRPEREPGRAPLLQVTLALQKSPLLRESGIGSFALGEPGGWIEGEALRMEAVPLLRQPAPFDLSLLASEVGEGLRLALVHETTLFDAATAARWARWLGNLAAGALADPERRLSDLELLGEAERWQLQGEWSGLPEAQSRQGLVHERVAARALESPAAVAARQGEMELTYGELQRRAAGLARHLRLLGVGPEQRVAVLSERRPEMLIGLLGVLQAGGAYVPLDPETPEERLAWMIRDARVPVLLTSTRLGRKIPQTGARTVLLEGPWDDGGAEGVAAGVGADNLAYVIYTSGSTGRPKGVEVTHGALRHLIDWHQDAFGITAQDVGSQLAGLGFDAAVWEIWPYLAAGAGLRLIQDELRSSAEGVLDWLLAEEVTLAFVPTALAEGLVELAWPPSTLRILLTGGDRLRVHPSPGLPFTVVNNYGPTEGTVVATSGTVLAGPAEAGLPGIGRPVAHARIYLLDPDLRPVPPGAAGELCLGGAGLARGYSGRPDQTAERFVPDPFASPAGGAGGRLYRTGDLARWRRDGSLEFLGRVDHQIKVRGFRIEPGEIESALVRHPGVGEALVLPLAGPGTDPVLTAFVAGPAVPSAGELRAFLAAELPLYMVPSSFVTLDALPLTASGKVDRRALAAQAVSGPVPDQGRTTPFDAVEEVLAGLWAEVLGREEVGTGEDFFSLGGHSLLAAKLLSAVRRVFGAEVALRRFFAAPTVAGLAEAVREARGGRSETAAADAPVHRPEHPPLSSAQERLWFLDRLRPGSPVYHIPLVLRLAGELRIPRLAAALEGLARRHEALRTSFPEVAGRPVQRIDPPGPMALPCVDLGPFGPDREIEAERWVTVEACRPFDLGQGPLLRALLLRLGERQHRLLLTLHHIVADGRSLEVLLRELVTLYEGAPLPPPPLQIADLAVRERDFLARDQALEDLAWWTGRLAGAPDLQLPADRPRPAVPSFRGTIRTTTLPPAASAMLAVLARRERVTPFMILLSAFATLLRRHTGEEDVVVGTPFSLRGGPLDAVIGLLVNALPLRIPVLEGPSFRDLLAGVRDLVLDASQRATVPFERIVETLQPDRSLERNPLFQVAFAVEHDLPERLAARRLVVEPHAVETGTAKFDLTLSVRQGTAGWTAAVEIALDLFDPPTGQRLLDGFSRLLAAAVADPDCLVASLPLLGDAERAQLLEWSRPAASGALAADGGCLHERFAEWARRTPEAPAVALDGDVLTYGELHERASRLAAHLISLGVAPGERVGVCLERSPDALVAILGVLQAGAVYAPLDPAYPPERLAYMARDSRLSALVTCRALRETLPDLAGAWIFLDTDGETIARRSPRIPEVRLPETSPAYLLYTSGSTGWPKGVLCHHAGALHLLDEAQRRQPLRPGAVCSLWTSLSFDVSVYEIFSALTTGARLEICPERVRSVGKAFAEWLCECLVESAYVPPSMLGDLAAALERMAAPLRRLLVGVEPISEELLATLAARAPGLRILNGYGPTEAAICATLYPVDGAPRHRRTPVGRPFPGREIRVLDRGLEPVPIGAPGELYVAGPGLALGYAGRSDLTAAAFLPDVSGEEPGGRMYRTGDLAKWLPAGDLELLGRIDDQVKVRGVRVEPGEVAAALRGHPAVRDAAVVAWETAGDRWLAAYFVPAAAAGADPSVLREHLRARLPEAMVPSVFLPLDALPLTPNGKLDRRALPRPQRGSAEAFVPPRSPVEERLAALWADLLGVERVGRHDNFFALGGHSLKAGRLASRVREELGADLPLRAIFEAPTLEAMAAALTSAGPAAAERRIVPRPRPAGPAPLSFGQQQIWFLQQLAPESPLFNLPAGLSCSGRLSVEALAASLHEILHRHEALRSRFTVVNGQLSQVPTPAGAPLLALVDLAALPAEMSAAEARRLGREEAGRAFDLARGELLRASLLRLAEESHILLLTLHHIGADAPSAGLLVRQLGRLYAELTAGRPVHEPAPPVQYGDFAAWQRATLQGEVLEGLLRYWQARLGDRPTGTELPTDRPRPLVQTHRAARWPVRLGAGEISALRRLAVEEGASLFMGLLAIFDAVLQRHARTDDVIVGTAAADRPEGTEETIGLFLDTLVLRTSLAGDPSFRSLLGRVRGRVLEDFAHASLPFLRLVEALQPERDLSRSPLFQIFFALRNDALPELALPGLVVRPLEVHPGAAQFDLALSLTEEENGGVAGWLEHNADLFDDPTMGRLALHLETLLAGAMAHPGRRLSDLSLLSPGERAQVLREWNDRAVPAPPACVHDLIASQAERTPEAVAVVHRNDEMTYGELLDLAARLSLRLRGMGVRAGDRVGVCVERSVALPGILLGILASGAAYVPLDPDYPAARLAAMLEDSGAAALVTRAGLASRPEHAATLFRESLGEEPAGSDAWTTVPAESQAYVIYTSGSTGRPKGVVVSHRNVASFFHAMDAHLAPAGPGVWLAVTSISFDISVLELLWTLARGFKVILQDAPDSAAAEELPLPEQIARHRVTHLQCTPSLGAMLAADPQAVAALAPLSHLLLGGEALPEPLARRLGGATGGCLHNVYGPTEATVWATAARIGQAGTTGRVTLGRPLSNTGVHLLDDHLRPVPVGVPGEIFLGGAGVATGYWQRPDLTAERFVPDPFGESPGSRLYRTGDLGRRLADGTLDFLGRLDHQVKLRGHRIELGEVEAALRGLPGVAEAVVAAREDTPGDRRLVGWFVATAAAGPADLTPGGMRRRLAGKLPGSMLPAALVRLDSLPRTPNGKIDRRALPAPDGERPQLAGEYVPPKSRDEQTVAAVWCEVLRRDRVGVHDNFFELGGTSLLLVEAQTRLQDTLHREVPLAQLFRHVTVHDLARWVASQDRGAPVRNEAQERARLRAEALQQSGLAERQKQIRDQRRARPGQRRP